MRAWIFSDLHIRNGDWDDHLAIPDADICICAGGVCKNGPANSISYLGERISRLMPVILVPGNHEYHGSSIIEGGEAASAAAARFPDLHLMDRKVLFLDGVRFVGTTLWGDEELLQNQMLSLFFGRRDADDFMKIKHSKRPPRRFSSRELGVLTRDDRTFVRDALKEVRRGPTVVVTHHAPSIMSMPKSMRPGCAPLADAEGLERRIMRSRPEIWVHGNLYSRRDYHIGATRVICNPRGNPDSPVSDFDPRLVVDLFRHPTARAGYGGNGPDETLEVLN